MGSDLKSPWGYGCNAMSSNQGGGQNQEFVELGSSYMMEKSLLDNSIINDGRVISSLSLPTNAFSGEDNSSSMLASLVVESNPRDSSLIDLKLGRLNDQANIRTCSASVAKTNLYSLESTIPVKRARARGLGSQTPYCQVQGCKKDLSSCKYYHKRHKVCEIHSKTSIVIVNGIEQRFCQQCSRFHLLAEFDEGKRSCRRRLAGHNKRRRKPHVHPGREGALFHSCNTTTEKGNLIPAASFVSCNAFSSCWLRNEDKTVLDSSSTIGGLSRRSDVSSSGCAPSLLSSQSQRSSTLSPVVPTALPLVSSGNRALYGLTEPPQKFLDVSSQVPLSSTGRSTTNRIDRIIQQPANMNSQNHFPFQIDHTIDLLQLSSQLQRVEDQRQYLMMKHDDDNFYGYKNP